MACAAADCSITRPTGGRTADPSVSDIDFAQAHTGGGSELLGGGRGCLHGQRPGFSLGRATDRRP